MARIAVTGLRGVPATWGGVEHHCEELYSRLAVRGHDIVIFARSHYVPGDFQSYKGMSIFRLSTVDRPGIEAFLHTLRSILHILKANPDIVHIHGQGPCLMSWLPRLFRPRMRVFFTCHGLDWQRKKWSKTASAIIRLGEICSARFPHYRIAVSKELQKYYRERYGVHAHYIPSGVRRMEKRPPEFIRQLGFTGKDYFLFVGRLVPEKKIDELIRAYLQKERRSGLVIVGESAGTEEYVARLKSLSENRRSVIFAGYQYGSRLEELFSNARAFVSASELEGLPLTMLEALSYGLPCIASDIPPHKEILEHQPDLVFPTGGIDDASQLMDMVDDMPDGALEELGKRALAILDRDFNWVHVVEATERLYLESLA